MYLPRALEAPILRASEQFPALLVTGPRQTGKTTLLRNLAKQSGARRYASLDDPALRELAREDPRLFLQRFPPPLLLDEIQYAPQLLPLIKLAIDDERNPGAFWLTGSQQFHAMRGITETLAGRVAIVNLLGFSQRERLQWGTDVDPFIPSQDELHGRGCHEPPIELIDLYRMIWTGALPELATNPKLDRDLFLNSYVQTYLQRDVRDLAQVGDLEAFMRFVRACAARTGQLLNLSDLARDVDISVPTAKTWLSVLVASFQVHLLQPWHNNVTKRLVKTPKLYFLDTGLCSYLTGWSSPETLASGAMAGAMLETQVVVEILKSYWHRGRQPSMYFYRDRDGREVDILLERDQKLWAVEVKRSATVRREWAQVTRPLQRLEPPLGGAAVVCLAPQIVPVDARTLAVPVGCL